MASPAGGALGTDAAGAARGTDAAGGAGGTETVRIIVYGHVQGVGFRDGACRRARDLALRGWVRNRPDGTVELLVHGTAAAVREMCAWCARGPRAARVTDVSAQAVDPAGLSVPEGFAILH